MIRVLRRYETDLAEVAYLIECGWEALEVEDIGGFWLYKEV